MRLPSRPAPRRPVLFFNPKSGGGKAEKFSLADEARARGIEPIELRPGQDLEQLVRNAVADGADGLAMAGGDGSQAVRTLLDTLPETLGPDGTGLDLRWTGPGGHEHSAGVAILVSNNRYRLGHAVGSGTRPRIDDALLGIAIVGALAGGGRLAQRPWRDWSAPTFEVGADHPVPPASTARPLGSSRPCDSTSAPVFCARASRASTLVHRPPPHCPMGSRRALAPTNHNEGAVMDIFSVEQKERLSREEVAARLHKLADMLARNNDVEFDRGGTHFTVNVPDEVELKIELEVESDERELEIELTW